MSLAPRIIVNNLSFHLSNTAVSLCNICLSFEALKYGIVGDNGVGKTTLLKLLSGELAPDNGSVVCSGSQLSIPQTHAAIAENATVGDVLSVSKIITALHRVNSGDFSDHDFEIISDQWDIESRIESAMKHFNLSDINMNALFSSLSGGQKTKILLAKILIFQADFILFDEPTNNLDKESREILYRYIDECRNGVIVVSHDRTLLNKMDRIIEITTKGIQVYGGNYDFYRHQKDIELAALEREFDQAKRTISQVKSSIQKNKEKHDQSASRGKKSGPEKLDKFTMGFKKDKSDQSKSRASMKEEKLIAENLKIVSEIREKVEIKNQITASLDATKVPNGKIVLEIEHLFFKYEKQIDFLMSDFSLCVTGPERIAISGENGTGKSTLIKLIRTNLEPISGKIRLGVEQVAYLDQELSFLDRNLTLVDIFLKLNPDAKIFDAYYALAEFQFRNKDAEKKVGDLSGGERIRAALAICLMSQHPPQLIILDEPTNHLDMRSIESIENILTQYQGAILAVSHDENFLKNIHIERQVSLIK